MAVTFVELVDQTLHRVGVFHSATEYLALGSTVTASEFFEQRTDHQNSVNLALQFWQDAMAEVYALQDSPPLIATATITLVADQREYTLATDDFERVAGNTKATRVLRSATTGVVLPEYRGGYLQMLADQPTASDYQGEPTAWAISPTTEATIRLDRDPQSDEAGWTYYMAYEKTINLTSTMATATMVVSDTVARSLVQVVAEAWKSEKDKSFNVEIFRGGLIRALSMNARKHGDARYGIRRGH